MTSTPPLTSSNPQPALLLSPQPPLLTHKPHSFLCALLAHFPTGMSAPRDKDLSLQTEPGVTGVHILARQRKNHHRDSRCQALFHRPYRYKFLWTYQPHFTGGGTGAGRGGPAQTPHPLPLPQAAGSTCRVQAALQAADTECSGHEAGVWGRDFDYSDLLNYVTVLLYFTFADFCFYPTLLDDDQTVQPQSSQKRYKA